MEQGWSLELECGYCGDVPVNVVCHECGRPLCNSCRVHKADNAFDRLPRSIRCRECFKKPSFVSRFSRQWNRIISWFRKQRGVLKYWLERI